MPQRRQSGEEQANKDHRSRQSRKPAGAEPEAGPTYGDEKTGDDNSRQQGASQAFDQQRRPGQQGQAAQTGLRHRRRKGRPILLHSPPPRSRKDNFAPKKGFMSTTSELCRFDQGVVIAAPTNYIRAPVAIHQHFGDKKPRIIGSRLHRAISASGHHAQKITDWGRGIVQSAAPDNRLSRRRGRRCRRRSQARRAVELRRASRRDGRRRASAG